MFLVCGLGNKDKPYHGTRHNIGYLVLDALSRKRRVPISKKLSGCVVGEADEVLLAKPDTYMNISGGPVSALMRKRRVPPDRLLVVHDDLDMEFARMRFRWDGGDGGHKGVRSIADSLGTPLFFRMKIGIGRDPSVPPDEYVLSRFSPDEAEALPGVLSRAAEAIEVFLAEGMEKAMNLFNR